MRHSALYRSFVAGLTVSAFTIAARGELITINPVETPFCDVLSLPNVVHELGNPPVFPSIQAIETLFTFTQQSACPTMDNPNIPNILLVMTNLSPFAWVDVHYVADAGQPGAGGTLISNEDGLVTGGQAFRIDYVGVNVPLVFESFAADTVFMPGETWHFIIQDYSNAFGLPPHAMTSIGVGLGSFGPPSSGSNNALEIPAPGSIALLAISGMVLRGRRRR
jgi:hypothetical protein